MRTHPGELFKLRVLLNTPHFLLNTPHTPHPYYTTICFVRQTRTYLSMYDHYHTTLCLCRQMVSDLPSSLLLAHNRRLKLFAFVKELLNNHDALATTCRIHLNGYFIFKKWQQPCFSRERHKNEWNKSSRFTERNQIHTSQQKLLLRTINCTMELHVFLIKPIMDLR